MILMLDHVGTFKVVLKTPVVVVYRGTALPVMGDRSSCGIASA